MHRSICPACETNTLETFTVDRHEVERCRRCNGLCFDEPELMAYIEDHANESTNSLNLLSDPTTIRGLSTRYCHCCDQLMVKHELLENHSTEIDACHSCKSFWIDAEEIRHVQHSQDLRVRLTEINKGFSWRSWLFQVLLWMPVEYNAKPKATPWVTYCLLAINVLVFSFYYLFPRLDAWIYYSGSVELPIENQQQFLVSLLTAQFIHYDLLHLLGNLYFLWIIGDNIEDALGKWRYLVLYLATGVAGFLLEVGFAMHEGREMLLMGASAGVSGLFGMYLVWYRHAKLSVMLLVYQLRLHPMWYFGIWLATNIYGLMSGAIGSAYLAHLGGFLAGLLFAWIFAATVYKRHPLLQLLNTPSKVY